MLPMTQNHTAPPRTSDLLDADELLQLALRASDSDQSEQALIYLKRALEKTPTDARLHYLLGAEHAHMGLYERAVVEMQRAVKLDAGLHTAHFQLGLLHMTSGRMEEAAAAWQPLDKLPPNKALRLFKTALEHLSRDEFDPFFALTSQGMQSNDSNAALNQDMQRLMAHVESQRATMMAPAKTAPAAPADAELPTDHHVLLNGYKRD
jgi:tetratricopeptide (TPR) repeat protein